MKMSKTSFLVMCLSAWCVAVQAAPQVLSATDAKLIGKFIKVEKGVQLGYWKSGESAEWTFSTPQAAEQFVTIEYSAVNPSGLDVWLDGVKVQSQEMPKTGSWTKFTNLSLGKTKLTKGSHTMRLTASSDSAYCLNLKKVVLSSSASIGDVAAAPVKGSTSGRPAAAIVLSAADAKLVGEKIKMEAGTQIAYWVAGESAEWTFDVPQEATQELVIHYASVGGAKVSVMLDGIKRADIRFPTTQDWKVYRDFSCGELSLSKGVHTLRLTVTAGNGYRLNVQSATFGGKVGVAPLATEYPKLYKKGADWADTLVGMRKKFADPAVQEVISVGGKKLDIYLNKADGKALWTDFAVETDWFLQDNQVHGEWGKGVYDARKDYQHYLDPARDNTLEQKLVAHVLQDLGPDAKALSKELANLTASNCSPDDAAWLTLYTKACRLRRTARLAPLLKKTDKLVYATHMNMGVIYLATETQPCPDGSQLRIIDLSPEANGQPLRDELLFDSENGIVRDPEVSFDGKKMLFAWRKTNKQAGTNGYLAPETGNYKIYEMDLATRQIRALTDDSTYGADFEPCYLASGDIMFSSARCVQEVTCGWGDCSNLYLMNKDGKYARRVGFDQTQTAFPHLLDDGRVVYTRRDYNDRGQSYAHALFFMNPDGTTQTEYYGNNSMAPTSIQHTRPIPGTGKTMGIAGGYHTSQGGKLVTIDPKKGRQNYEGLTFYNWEPTPLREVNDENYCRVGEQFVYPYPLDENSLVVSLSPVGAYMTRDNGMLDKAKEQGLMLYKLYYMNLDGSRELLAANPTLSCTQGVPVMARKRPGVRASTVDYTRKTGTCYVQNVYYGPSAEGIEPGAVKKLRVVKLFYKPVTIGAGGWGPSRKEVGPLRKYSGYGWHSVLPTGVGSASFDAKEIMGEVEVHEDGSAMFEVPARVPFFFQLVDKDGLVIQTMRSWATLMPNENFSCVGCHEENDSAPLPQAMKTLALQRPPQTLQPVHSISGQPFSYTKFVQPIFDEHCVCCHSPGKKGEKIDLSSTIVKDFEQEKWASSTRRKFNQSYLTLLKVKWDTSNKKTKGPRLDEGRPNEWVDYYTRMATMELTPPYYSGSTQSGMIKKLLAGHGKTKITPEEIGTIAAWIDLNVPFVGEYDAMNIWDDATKERYDKKLGMRVKQEQIEAENIKAYIRDGQL